MWSYYEQNSKRILLQVFLCHMLLFFLGKYLVIEWQRHMASAGLTLRNCQTVFHNVPFTFLRAVYEFSVVSHAG
jgi:hypothetical protein